MVHRLPFLVCLSYGSGLLSPKCSKYTILVCFFGHNVGADAV